MELPPNAGHPAIILWDVSRGQLLAQLPQTGTQVYDLAVTADGHRVIAAYLDGDVVDWTTDASTALNQVCKLAGRPFRTPRAGVGQTFGFDWTRHGLQLLFAILGIGAGQSLQPRSITITQDQRRSNRHTSLFRTTDRKQSDDTRR